jgi:hypothetical protein
MRYGLRTLLIILALAPPVLATAWMIFAEPPGELANFGESMAFAIVALVGCVFGPMWIESLRTRIFQ